MALINYAEYFDLDGFNAAIKTLETTNKEFGSSVLSLNKEIKASYNGVTQEIRGQIETLQKFNVNQRDAGQELAKVGAESAKLRDRLQDQNAAMQGLLQIQDLNRASTKELKTAAKELQKQYESLGGASADIAAKKAVLAREFQRITEAAQVQQQALKITKKVVDDAAGSYNALNREALDILRQLKAMPNAFDAISGKINENNVEAVALSKRYIELNGTLKNIDAGLGNFQRNVGNYKSGFNGLSNSINQITREFPAFSNSVQTGFLAISNNLPIFFDEISRTSKEIKAMRAQGEQVPGLFSQLTKSIFSFGSVLSLGVTLLTLYGKDITEFVASILKTKKPLDEAAESVKLLNKAFEDSSVKKAVENVSLLTNEIALAKDGFISKEGAVKHYNETIGKTTGLVKTLDEAEAALIKNGEAYIQMTLYKAAANLALEDAAKKMLEAEQTRLKKEKEFSKAGDFQSLGFAGQGGAAAFKSAEEEIKKQRQARRELAAKESEKDAKTQEDIATKFLKKAAEISKDFKFNFFGDNKEDKSGEDKALRKYERELRRRQDALKAEYDAEVALAQEQLDNRIIDEVGFQKTKFNAAKEYSEKAAALENQKNTVGYKADAGKLQEYLNFKKKAENDFNRASIKASDDARKEDIVLLQESIADQAEIESTALKNSRSLVLANQQLTNFERKKLEIAYQNELDTIEIKSLEDRAELELDTLKKLALKKKAEQLKAGIINRTNFAEQVDLPQASAKDQISALQFVLEQRKLVNQATIADELKTQQAIYKILKESGQLTIEQEREWELKLQKMTQDVNSYILSSLKDAAGIVGNYLGTPFESVFNDISDVFLKLQDKAKITWENIGAYASDASTLATTVFKSGIDQQISALQYRESQELAAVGNNQSAQAQIREKFARQEAALKLKQAKADRLNAIFQIGINTAQAVVKSVAASPLTFGLPFSAYALATGALETALVLAKPLPQYAKGTENSEEGFAIVDEKGPELILGPDGRIREMGGMYVGSDGRLKENGKGPRVTWLEKGSKVKTAAETRRLLDNPETAKIIREMEMNNRSTAFLMAYKQDAAVHAMSMALQTGAISEKAIVSAFKQAVKDIPIHQTIIDREGERLRVIEGNNRTTYLNQFKIGSN